MNETLTLNLEYKSPNIKVKLLPAGGAKKSDDTDKAKKINDEIGKERGAVIDSAIVKTMKTNKDRAVKNQEVITKVMEMITLF